jgi:hypothetical protein
MTQKRQTENKFNLFSENDVSSVAWYDFICYNLFCYTEQSLDSSVMFRKVFGACQCQSTLFHFHPQFFACKNITICAHPILKLLAAFPSLAMPEYPPKCSAVSID